MIKYIFLGLVFGIAWGCARGFCLSVTSSEPAFHRFTRTLLLFLLFSASVAFYTLQLLFDNVFLALTHQIVLSYSMCLLWSISLLLESYRKKAANESSEPEDFLTHKHKQKMQAFTLVIIGSCMLLAGWLGLFFCLVAISVGFASWQFDKTFVEHK